MFDSQTAIDMIDYVDSITQSRPPLGPQLQIALDLIPAHTWYAVPSGALTFLNERGSDYLGLPKDDPIRLGIDTGAAWDSDISLLHPDDHEETRRVWSTCLRTGCAGQVSFRVRNAAGGYRWFLSRAEPCARAMEFYCIGSGSVSTLKIGGAIAPHNQADGSMGWALPLDPTLRVIHMGDINELGDIVAGAFAHPDEAGNGQYLPLVGDFMSFNEIVETLNRQGHTFHTTGSRRKASLVHFLEQRKLPRCSVTGKPIRIWVRIRPIKMVPYLLWLSPILRWDSCPTYVMSE